MRRFEEGEEDHCSETRDLGSVEKYCVIFEAGLLPL